jgi:ferredoxin-fold anticodon binding domain-containing protein
LTSLFGKTVKYPIKDVQILSGKQFEKIMNSTKSKNDQMSQAYHNKFMTVVIFSQANPEHIQDLVFFEKEVIDCMDDNI